MNADGLERDTSPCLWPDARSGHRTGAQIAVALLRGRRRRHRMRSIGREARADDGARCRRSPDEPGSSRDWKRPDRLRRLRGWTHPSADSSGPGRRLDLRQMWIPSWSPDAQRSVLLIEDGRSASLTRIESGRAAGQAARSRDGHSARLVARRHEDRVQSRRRSSETANADGTGLANVPDRSWSRASWQPIPVNSYPRPKGASPARFSLVPAYATVRVPRTARTAPPLASHPSCSRSRSSDSLHLTVATPDVNGAPVALSAATFIMKTLDRATPRRPPTKPM